jgi:hypothetical protein
MSPEPVAEAATPRPGIQLLWIPLGAGGSGWVRINGRIYERVCALIDGRRPVALYHTALRVRVPDGEFLIETVLPSPGGDPTSRGVALVAPLFSRWAARLRLFRYEVRCWRDGHLPDANEAVGGPQQVESDGRQAQALLDLVGELPPLVWGRDERGTGEMWNSNSVISWLLTRSGVAMDQIGPPAGGRAPGWDAGVTIARAEEPAAPAD